MYSEALNASLQSALGFAENNLPFLAHSGAAAASMASFHHHQQEKQGLEYKTSSEDNRSKVSGFKNSTAFIETLCRTFSPLHLHLWRAHLIQNWGAKRANGARHIKTGS